MNSLNNLSETTIKAFFAFILLISVTVGFFMKLVEPSVFIGIVSMALTHYYNNEATNKLHDQLDKKEVEMQSLREAKIVDLQ